MSTTKKILIVDDDDALRESLREQFSLHDEFVLTDVANATAGVKLVKADHADLVLLDVNLPDMDGALKCLSLGYASTLAPANNKAIRAMLDMRTRLAMSDRLDLLFDPQTAGGLLIGIAAAQAPDLLARLRDEAGTPRAAIVGRVLPRAGDNPLLTLVDGDRR